MSLRSVIFTHPPASSSSFPASCAIRLPNVICTPHIGGSTVEAGERVLTEVCSAVLEALRGTIPADRIVNGKPETSVRLARLKSESN